MAGKQQVQIGARVSRLLYFEFKAFCHAHCVPVERGIEEALRSALERAGVVVPAEGEQGKKPAV